jgi:chromosomal replication initiator protein
LNENQAWQAALGQLQMDMPKASFDTWVRNSDLVEYDESCFTIGVQNAYARDWLESRLTSTATHILTGLMQAPQTISFVVSHQDDEIPSTDEALPEAPPSSGSDLSTPMVQQPNPSLSPRYTFGNFVVGSSNRLAHAASLAVAESPARAYNPLFLYGGVGLGKTHLLHAIGNSVHARGMQVLYVSSEEFTNDFIHSVRTHMPVAFRERYRQIDVLMIDDIQFLANKEQTQEEFFHTFNTLHGQDKQIIITSDRPPKAMVTLEERLRSRFEWGLIADIQPPDLETRIAILRSKAERAGRRVTDDILDLIARQIQSNIRELEGALTRIFAYSDLSGYEINPELVTSALADLLPQRSAIEPEQVLRAVAAAFGVTTERLLGRDRSREVALPRQIAMYLLRQEANNSLPQIGETLGGRDHTTVMHACSKVADLIERDDQLRRKIIMLREQIYGAGAVVA